MRLGTTSYIYPSDLITNVRQLAGTVKDIELVIFECDDYGDNLPDKSTLDELTQLGGNCDMTYTVHLPLDLRLADDDPQVEKAVRVIRCTKPLSPHGFIVHLDGARGGESLPLPRWMDNCRRSLDILIKEVGDAQMLCAENLDDQSSERLDAVLDGIEVSCCIDLGHLWKQGIDPIPCIERWLPRARVVHLHGVGSRDHKRLSLIPLEKLDDVVGRLHADFDGVVTLEVFDKEDLDDSVRAFEQSVQRLTCRA
jgi:adenosylcobalamin phosphodiesterase